MQEVLSSRDTKKCPLSIVGLFRAPTSN